MASSTSSMPVPSLAEHRMASAGSSPRSSSISVSARSMSADGRSILLITGTHLEVVLHRQVEIGHGLGLDPLRGVDQQQRTLAGHQRPSHLVGEIDVTGSVDQIQLIGLAVLGRVVEGDGVALDRDAALALDVHRVQDLVAKVAFVHAAAVLDQAVGQGGLAVVDVGDDAEVADVLHVVIISENAARRRGPALCTISGFEFSDPSAGSSGLP